MTKPLALIFVFLNLSAFPYNDSESFIAFKTKYCSRFGNFAEQCKFIPNPLDFKATITRESKKCEAEADKVAKEGYPHEGVKDKCMGRKGLLGVLDLFESFNDGATSVKCSERPADLVRPSSYERPVNQ